MTVIYLNLLSDDTEVKNGLVEVSFNLTVWREGVW